MYYLKKLDSGAIHYLYSGSDLLVSRQPSHWLCLSEDNSISRKHAAFRLVHTIDNVKKDRRCIVQLLELGAKNGSYLSPEENASFPEGSVIGKNASISLTVGAVIRFGINNSIFQLCQTPFTVSTSCLTNNETILADLLIIGGTFSKNWSNKCTHLIMENIKISPKVVYAMASCKPILSPKYLSDIITLVKAGKSVLPPTAPYLPPITEPNIKRDPSIFEVNAVRKSLFRGKFFLFSNPKSLKKLAIAVENAGGKASVLIFNEHQAGLKNLDFFLVKVSEDKQLIENQPNCDMNRALQLLAKHSLYTVPESDIGLALLYTSTERFCNPSFSQQLLLNATSTQLSSASSTILAQETQNLVTAFALPSTVGSSKTQISETTCASGQTASRKRQLSSDDTESFIESQSKRVKELNDSQDSIQTQIFQEDVESQSKFRPGVCSTQLTVDAPVPLTSVPNTPSCDLPTTYGSHRTTTPDENVSDTSLQSLRLPTLRLESHSVPMDIPDDPAPTLEMPSLVMSDPPAPPQGIKRSDSMGEVFAVPSGVRKNRRRRLKTELDITAVRNIPGPPSLPLPDDETPITSTPLPVTSTPLPISSTPPSHSGAQGGGVKRSRSPPAPSDSTSPPSRKIKVEMPSVIEETLDDTTTLSSSFIPNSTIFMSKTSETETHNQEKERSRPQAPLDITVKEEADTYVDLEAESKKCRTITISLLVRTTVVSDNNQTYRNKKNFKTFIKQTTGGRGPSAPIRVIGGRDLRPHTEFTADGEPSRIDMWMNDHPEVSTILHEETTEEQARDTRDLSEEASDSRGTRGDTRDLRDMFASHSTSSRRADSLQTGESRAVSSSSSSGDVFTVTEVAKRTRRGRRN